MVILFDISPSPIVNYRIFSNKINMLIKNFIKLVKSLETGMSASKCWQILGF